MPPWIVSQHWSPLSQTRLCPVEAWTNPAAEWTAPFAKTLITEVPDGEPAADRRSRISAEPPWVLATRSRIVTSAEPSFGLRQPSRTSPDSALDLRAEPKYA